MSDFAKNQLLKHGWKEGKGLGKDEDGITNPVKVTLKSGLEGLGFKETFNPWWEDNYNRAIRNILVKSNEDGDVLSTVDNNFSKNGKDKSKAHLKYGNFQKTSVLHNGHLIQDNFATSEEKKDTAQDFVKVSSLIEQLQMTPHNEVMPNIVTKKGSLCMSSGKLERIASQDRSLSSVSRLSFNHSLRLLPSSVCSSSIFSLSQNLQNLSSPLKHTSGAKPQQIISNKTHGAHEEDETNNNSMIQILRTLTGPSKSKNKKFRKKVNHLTQQFNSCSIKQTDTRHKCDHLNNESLRNIKSNRRKECFKIKKPLEYARSTSWIKKQDICKKQELYTTKEDTNKQARIQVEKEYESVQIIQFETNNDTPSSKEGSYASHESLSLKRSTCLNTYMKLETSQHRDTSITSAQNVKNSLYFHKCKNKRKNKHKHNQRSKIEDIIKNIANKRDSNVIDVVEKALKEINLTEDVSATIKKKPTQTHITPV